MLFPQQERLANLTKGGRYGKNAILLTESVKFTKRYWCTQCAPPNSTILGKGTKMRSGKICTILIVTSVLGLAALGRAAPVGTAITYQGRLIDANRPADGLYDFEFLLFDDPDAGSLYGSPIDVNDLDVIDGYFTVELDFGSGIFNGDARWLQVVVRPGDSNDVNDFAILSPRQQVTPTPYALYAKNAPGDGDWQLWGSDMYALASGNVGVGTTKPSHPLHVVNPSNSTGSRAIYGLASSTGTGQQIWGVYGQTDSSATQNAGAAVMGYASSAAGSSAGVRGEAKGTNGKGVFAWATSGSGTNFGLYAVTQSDDGYAGYFRGGRNYFEGNVGIGRTSPAYKLDVVGDVRVTGTIHGTVANADTVDGYDAGNGSGQVAVSNGTICTNLNADKLDGFHAGAFAAAAHEHDARYVNVVGDSMTGSLDVASSPADYAVKGIGDYAPTDGYLGVQGTADFDGVTTADWSGKEIGVVGISAGGTTADNYGLLGHSNGAGVRGEYSDNPANDYGELGKDGYGLYAKGSTYAGYFDGKVYVSDRIGINTTPSSLYKLHADAGGSGTAVYAVGGSSYSLRAEWDGSSMGAAILAKNTGTGGDAIQAIADGTGRSAIRAVGSAGVQYALYADADGADWSAFCEGDVKIDGNVHIYDGATKVMELGAGLDYAEGFDVSAEKKIEAGSVLIIDADNPGKLALSNTAYDTKVAGIVAGANGVGSGVRLGAGQFDYDVALAGRVYCNVDATAETVEPGDLLTTSATPGYAMKAVDYTRAQGAILGKAMERLEKGQKGQILVLVTLQ